MSNNPQDMFGSNRNGGSSTSKSKGHIFGKNISQQELFDAKSINKSISAVNKSIDNMFGNLSKHVASFKKQVAGINSDLDQMVIRLGSINGTFQSINSTLDQSSKKNDKFASESKRMIDLLNKKAEVDKKLSSSLNTDRSRAFEQSYREIAKLSKQILDNQAEQSRLEEKIINSKTSRTRDKYYKQLEDLKSEENNLSSRLESVSSNIDDAKSRNKKLTDEFMSAIQSAIKVFTSRLSDGVNKYFDAYEASFTQISTRMNIDYDTTRKFYSNAIDTVYSNGMSSVINIAEDMVPAMQAVASQGLTGDIALSKAYGDATAKVLLPWLETNSDAFVNLSANLSQQQMDNLKGQQLQLRETQSGNRLLQSGVINSLTNDLSPLLTNIDYNIGGANNLSAEYQAMMSELVDRGMSTSDAYSSVQELIKTDKNPYAAVTSGNTSQALYAINKEQYGMNSIDAFNNSYGMFNDIAKSYKNSPFMSGAISSATGSTLGMDEVYAYQQGSFDTDTKNQAKELANSAKNEKTYNDYISSSKEHITATKKLTNTLENTSASTVGQWITAIPAGKDWFNIVTGLLTGILSALALDKLGDKIGDKISNKLFKSSGKGSVASEGAGWLTKLVGGHGATGGLSSMQALGNGLVNTHSGTLTSSATTLGGAATAAGAAAGVAMAAYGTKEAVKDFSKVADRGSSDSEKKDAATTGTLNAVGAAGGAVGAGALIALGASNPVGWVALAVGGVALGAAALYKVYNQQSGVMKEVNEKYEKQKEVMKQEQEVRAKQIEDLKTTLENAKTTEDKRNAVVSQGIMSQEEANNMTSAQLDTFVEQLSKANERIADKETEFFEDIEKARKEEQESMREQNKEAIMEQIKNEKDTDKQKEMLKSLGYSDEQINTLGQKTGGFLGIGSHDKTVEDLLNERTENKGWFGLGGQSKLDAVDSNTYNDFVEKFGTEGAQKLGDYSTETDQEIAKARAFLNEYKDKKDSMTSSQKSQYDKYKEFLSGQKDISTGSNYDVSMYAAGNPYVASDQLAYLHQGEAVLTKTQNKNYRSVASSIPFLSKVFGGGLFGGPLAGDKSEEDSSRTDIITAINENVNKLVEAILSINKSQSQDTVDYNSGMINRNAIANRGYDQNLVSLSPSIATSTK